MDFTVSNSRKGTITLRTHPESRRQEAGECHQKVREHVNLDPTLLFCVKQLLVERTQNPSHPQERSL